MSRMKVILYMRGIHKLKQRRRYFEQVKTISCAVGSGQSITVNESVFGKKCTEHAIFYAAQIC